MLQANADRKLLYVEDLSMKDANVLSRETKGVSRTNSTDIPQESRRSVEIQTDHTDGIVKRSRQFEEKVLVRFMGNAGPRHRNSSVKQTSNTRTSRHGR